MADLCIFYRTNSGRLELRPEVLPELVAYYSLRLIQCERAIDSAAEAMDTPAATWGEATRDSYIARGSALRYLIASAGESVNETELMLCLIAAHQMIDSLTGGTGRLGRSKPSGDSLVRSIVGGGGCGAIASGNPELPAETRPADCVGGMDSGGGGSVFRAALDAESGGLRGCPDNRGSAVPGDRSGSDVHPDASDRPGPGASDE